MNNPFIHSNEFIDFYYASNLDKALDILGKLNCAKLKSISYAYKFLGMYWKLDNCILSHGEYKTFKQLSKEWFI